MQEKYLHYLWRMKRLDFRNIHLVNNDKSQIKIEEIGWYNQDAGPDFFNGSVWINGIRWQGNIEIHIKSSDWYAHNHHLDPAYNNVILHVVYEHDKEVIVEGRTLPTIELKRRIDVQHLIRYQDMVLLGNTRQIPCFKQVSQHKTSLFQQVNVSFLNRIERKGLELLERSDQRNLYDLYYKAILSAAGGKTNALPMQELASILPYQVIIKESWSEIRTSALWFGVAGFLNRDFEDDYYRALQVQWKLLKQKYNLPEMEMKTWKFGGVRPYSFPTILLAQLNAFVKQITPSMVKELEVDELLEKINNLTVAHIHPFWETHYTFAKESKQRKLSFSKTLISNILINGIVPMLVGLKHLYHDFNYTDKAILLMENLPPENNSIMDYWKSLDIFPENALESQGLLELKNEFCNFKKCLSCKVGVTILEQKNEQINTKNSILL